MAEFVGYVVTETPRAFLFQDHFWENPDWLPKSQITTYREDNTTEVRVSASPWICKQKCITEYTYRGADEGIPQEEGNEESKRS